MPRPPPPNSLALQQQVKDWNTGNNVLPPAESPPPIPSYQALSTASRPLPPVPARNTAAVPSAVARHLSASPPAKESSTTKPMQEANNKSKAPPIPARSLPPIPPRATK